MLCTPFLYCYTVVANIIVKELRDTPSLHPMKPYLSSLKDTYSMKFWHVGHSIHDVLRECTKDDSAIVDKLTGLCSVHYTITSLYGPGVPKSCIVLCVVMDQVYRSVVYIVLCVVWTRFI